MTSGPCMTGLRCRGTPGSATRCISTSTTCLWTPAVEGRVRIWRDDELIFDRTDVPTITEAAGTINSFYLFTYWNNEQPPDNYCYIDDLTIATSASPPPNKDAKGNAYIGSW